jgi:CHAT domain-containing protein
LAALEYPQPLTLENTQRTLDDGTLLLSYMVSKEETFLFAVRNSAQQADAKLATFRLPISETELRKSVQTFRSGIQHVGESRSTWIQQGRELYDLLVRPAEKWVAASRRVVISPDGPLHRLPFGALVIEQPSDATSAPRYWIETKPLHVVTSATLYAELKKERRQAPVSLVAFGDPSYAAFAANRSEAVQDPEVRSATRQGFALGPLPSTRTEVQAIAELYGDQASVFLGTEATEERAKMIARDARYVHFATHGILDEQFPLNSALALTIPGRRVDGQDNGLLQAWEIFERVRIDADLVVLSACETALGKELGGEGLLGLTRAFQYAGARSIVASLWSVADESTAELMKRFYTYLKEGRTKDEALRSAQIDLIRRSRSTSLDTAHPFYWAAFELIGDWK